LFKNAPEVADRGTIYAIGLERALNAALARNARTERLKAVFKAVDRTQLDLLLSGSRVEINKNWLDFRTSHEKYPCRLSRRAHMEEPIMDQFICDHIVIVLYELVLKELKRHQGQPSDSDSFLCQSVHESLQQMPMMVAASPGRQSGEIQVSWTDLEGDVFSKIDPLVPKCRITLHRESTCSSRRYDLLAPSK
jgi:hypothetical protein